MNIINTTKSKEYFTKNVKLEFLCKNKLYPKKTKKQNKNTNKQTNQKTKTKNTYSSMLPWRMLLPYFYLLFFLVSRLTPVYMFTILVWMYLTPYFGDGPFWQNFVPRNHCPKYWWTNLLYINNFYPQDFAAEVRIFFTLSEFLNEMGSHQYLSVSVQTTKNTATNKQTRAKSYFV